MNTSSSVADARSRKALALALQRISLAGQAKLAEEMGVSPSTVSRFCSEEDGLARACRLLSHAGVKLVPVEFQCFPKDTVQAYMHLAKQHLNAIAHVDDIEEE